MPPRPSLDLLDHVHELNRLFLAFLRSAARERRDCLGLPQQAERALLKASPELLEMLAQFPHALFRLTLDDQPAAGRLIDPLRGGTDGAHYSLSLMILQSARALSRQSTYQARLLMGLSSRAMQRLRGMPLSDLPALARKADLVLCAFPERDWLWIELLRETRPEVRQQLTLIALQPWLEQEWPRRRFAQLSP